MPSHRINLRGPWDHTFRSEACADNAHTPISGTSPMPQEWRALFQEVAGNAQFRRKFHRPTNLDPHERVMIVFTEVRGSGQVKLNETQVGRFVADGESVEFEITQSLASFNELVIDISFVPHEMAGKPGGIFGVAALEIRSD